MIEIGKPRILIVDDEPVMRTITESVLSQHEFDVSTAQSAEQAIIMITEGKIPDLLLLDVLMPGMNGFEACRLLRHTHRLEHLPIIMLTALDDQHSIDEAYRCGATDFITKPLNIPLLPHRIRYLLRSAQAYQELVVSQIALVNTQQIARLGNWTMDAEGNITNASREFLQIIGATQLPVPERHLLLRVHREDRAVLVRQRAEMRMGRAYQLDYRLRSQASENAWYHVHERGFPRFDERQRYLGADGFTQDITDRIEQEERIRQLAWHDAVTGLNNRTRLTDLVDRELAMADETHALAMLFIHLANLREILTVLGHDIVDGALRALASRLKGLLENPPASAIGECGKYLQEAKLGRYDEHSFIIALPGTPEKEGLRKLALTVHEHLGAPMILQGEEIVFKTYIGIAYYPHDATDTPELMRRAMLVALHEANSSGTGNIVSFFDAKHDTDASQRMFLERGLRAALEQGGQLQPYFQPKICTRTGKMTGAEVLLRWLHPERGMISPGEFIPLAEEVGLIQPISEWLIGHVFDLIADWKAWGLEPGAISINLSADSFFDRSLIQFIDEELARTGIPTNAVIIELTESVLMRNADTARNVVGALRERGIRVSLDDFGTGFSSLGYLNRFTIDEIKIDRSFVIDLERDSKERALVQAIVTLGHALGLEVVAEGIETASQAELLTAMGCDILQGFHFARPIAAADFVERFLSPGVKGLSAA